MSFEVALLMQSFVAPLVISSAVAWFLGRCIRSKSIAYVANPLCVSHAWWLLAIIVLAIERRSLQFEEKWQQAVYWLWLPVLASGIASTRVKPFVQLLFATLAVAIFLAASLPFGAGWQDMESTKYVGWLVGGVAWLTNALLLYEPRSSVLSRVSLVWTVFASQAALAIAALSCYGSLGAWALSLTALAVGFTTFVASQAATDSIARSVLWPILAAGTLVALTAVLYGANPRPVLVALLVPSIVGIVDRLCRASSFNLTYRSWIALTVSTALLTLVVALFSAS